MSAIPRKFLLVLSDNGNEFTTGYATKFDSLDHLAIFIVDELDYATVARCFEDFGDDEPARVVTRELAEAISSYIAAQVNDRHSDDGSTWAPSEAACALLRKFNPNNAHEEAQTVAWLNERAA